MEEHVNPPSAAQVVVSIDHKDVDKAFHYHIPPLLQPRIRLGQSVTVPFGRGNKPCEGFVVGFDQGNMPEDLTPEQLKPILSINEATPFFSPAMLELAGWMQQKYYTTLYACLKCMCPTGLQFKSDVVVRLLPVEAKLPRLGGRQQDILALLKASHGFYLQSELENTLGPPLGAALKGLAAKGLVSLEDVSAFKDLTLKVQFVSLAAPQEDVEKSLLMLAQQPKTQSQAKVLAALLEQESIAVSDLRRMLNISVSPVKSLEKRGLVAIETVEVTRNTVFHQEAFTPPPVLTTAQQQAVDFITRQTDNKPVLLHGVTGSGKTEVYMHLIEQAVAQGKQAIMLVPEISLTPQTVGVFVNRFGSKVSVTHSRLTLGERFDQWKKARDGQTSIMIGPRSALFTPFNNLGIIIIDEEHEKTYQSETTPKYHAKDVAIMRGQLEGAKVVLGSATPSVETYYQAQEGQLHLVALTQRINRTLPEILVVDMRNELAEGNTSMFSNGLHQAMEENLANGQQTILFLNRRGFSTFVSCRKCGYVMTCDRCNVNHTYHLPTNQLICHYCGKKEANPKNCPQCGSHYIKYFGVGTQKIEDEVKRLFPQASVLRMDMDTTAGKHMHASILNRFKNGDAQILIGTQMIAKGLDFPQVTLVGIVAADLSLNNGDFRAGETTFQLLTQVSGRAGRSSLPGRVFIQTYNPEHYSIVFAKEHDYGQFYTHELALRQQLSYPPFAHVFSVLVTGEDEKRIIMTLFRLLDIMKHYNRKGLFEMLGPSPAAISKIKKKYRWKLLVKCPEEERLKNFVLYCVDKLKASGDVSGMGFNLTLNPALLV